MPETRVLVNFARFGSKTEFLMKFLNDSAWFCVEELKKQGFPLKHIIFDQKTDLDPKNPEKSGKTPFDRPL